MTDDTVTIDPAATGALRVTVGQIRSVVGDLAGNRQRILAAAAQAELAGADLLITPEMCLPGYLVDDLAGDLDFLDATMKELQVLIAELPTALTAAVGTLAWISDLPDDVLARIQAPKPHPLDANERWVVNALAIVRGGQVIDWVVKSLLPTYGVFDDARWFAPAQGATPPIDIAGVPVGFAICEDIWRPDIADALVADGARIIVAANASPYSEGKHRVRRNIASFINGRHPGVPVVYANMVGGQDEVVYDGQSFALAGDGQLAMALPAFRTSIETVDLAVPGAPAGRPPLLPVLVPTPDDTSATYQALVTALADYIAGTGTNGIIIGLSGGLDSALAATIAVDALGPSRVLGITMPGPYSSAGSVDDAVALAANLGIDVHQIPITDGYQLEKQTLGTLLAGPGTAVADENIQARLRALHLMTLANAENRIVLNTGNKSEASVGYFTLGGDSSGGFAILKDIYKTRAYELARWRNADAARRHQTPPIPQSTLEKPPSAELAPGQVDSGTLPAYEVLDHILRRHLEDLAPVEQIGIEVTADFGLDGPAVVAQVTAMVRRSEHKRRQVAPGVKVTDRAYGRDRRMPIINAFAP